MNTRKFIKKVTVIWVMTAIAVLAAVLWVMRPGRVQGAQDGKDTVQHDGEKVNLPDVSDAESEKFLKDAAEYIRAAAYAHIGRLCEEYTAAVPISELYDEDTLNMILSKSAEVLETQGIAADADTLRNTLINIVCRLNMEEGTREYAASMLAQKTYEYLNSIGTDMTDIDTGTAEFNRLIEEYMTTIFDEEKGNIKFDYDILTSDRDIIIQLLKSNGMSQSDAQNLCGEVISGINTVYTDMRLEAVRFLIDKEIDKAAGNISDDISEAVISAISAYKENIAEITGSIDRFSKQYQQISGDIDAMQKQISALETANSQSRDDSSEYSKNLAKLKKELNEQNSSLNKLSEHIEELKVLKESISILSVSHNDAKNQMQASVKALKSELLNIIESLREENTESNEEERIRTELVIADIQSVLDKINNEKLTLSEFETYRTKLSDLIENVKSDTNSGMDNISKRMEEEIQKMSESFSQYMIVSEAKLNEDKEAFSRNMEELWNRISQDKQSLESGMSNLNASLAQMLGELAEYKNMTGEKFDNIVSDIISANEHAERMEDRLTLTEDKYTSVEDRLAASEDKYTSVEDRLAASEDKYTSVEDRLTASEDKYTSVEDRLAASEDKYTSVEDRLAASEDKYTSVEDRLEASEDKIAASDGRIKALDAGVSFIKNALESVNDKIALFEEQLAHINDLISGNTSKINKLEGEMTELKKSVSDGKAKVAGAVTANGVYTAADAGFETIAQNINIMAEQNKQEVKYGSINVSAHNTQEVSYGTYEEYDGDECSKFEVFFPENSFICYRVYGKGEGYSYADGWHEPCRDNYIYVAEGGKNKWVLTGPNWHKPEFETEGLTLTVEYWYLPK